MKARLYVFVVNKVAANSFFILLYRVAQKLHQFCTTITETINKLFPVLLIS